MFAWSMKVFVVAAVCLLPTISIAQDKWTDVTAAEIHAGKLGLLGKHVRISGEVVKVSKGISRKYYIYIRDNSGSREQGTDTVTVISEQKAEVGDKVTAEAVVSKKRNFGFSDSYLLFLDEAVLSPVKR